ncbi:MAG: class IV adenylate cyclase [Planctomycetota bacterium]
MPVNVEYKARLLDRARAERICDTLANGPAVLLRQRDTYFRTDKGRLKLREETRDGIEQTDQLITYRRPDDGASRESDYTVELDAPRPDAEVLVVVEKERRFAMIGEVRVHIDRVEGVGGCIEFESLVNDVQSLEEARTALQRVLDAFAPVLGDPIAGSYADLVTPSA